MKIKAGGFCAVFFCAFIFSAVAHAEKLWVSETNTCDSIDDQIWATKSPTLLAIEKRTGRSDDLKTVDFFTYKCGNEEVGSRSGRFVIGLNGKMYDLRKTNYKKLGFAGHYRGSNITVDIRPTSRMEYSRWHRASDSDNDAYKNIELRDGELVAHTQHMAVTIRRKGQVLVLNAFLLGEGEYDSPGLSDKWPAEVSVPSENVRFYLAYEYSKEYLAAPGEDLETCWKSATTRAGRDLCEIKRIAKPRVQFMAMECPGKAVYATLNMGLRYWYLTKTSRSCDPVGVYVEKGYKEFKPDHPVRVAVKRDMSASAKPGDLWVTVRRGKDKRTFPANVQSIPLPESGSE